MPPAKAGVRIKANSTLMNVPAFSRCNFGPRRMPARCQKTVSGHPPPPPRSSIPQFRQFFTSMSSNSGRCGRPRCHHEHATNTSSRMPISTQQRLLVGQAPGQTQTRRLQDQVAQDLHQGLPPVTITTTRAAAKHRHPASPARDTTGIRGRQLKPRSDPEGEGDQQCPKAVDADGPTTGEASRWALVARNVRISHQGKTSPFKVKLPTAITRGAMSDRGC